MYSDLEQTNDVTSDSGITFVDGKTIKIELTLAENGEAYVTIHLEYALLGTTGWALNADQSYLQDLPFNVYSPHVLADGTLVTDITLPFQTVGKEK